ncbi:MAG: KUP/HAK/KT family potassium transporter, partial [Verrucomicrobia bacterium]|nr:KUP/HAK/KT family potassium transporter [Verrucomicrobiota bacterium]
EHTSPDEKGQIYVPRVNFGLMLACIGLVLAFQSSSNLAGAYGVAVSLTMIITTVLLFFAARWVWEWPLWKAGLVCAPFFAVEAGFSAATSLKIVHGGWFPLLAGVSVFTVLTTWKGGRKVLRQKLADATLPFETFLEDMRKARVVRVPGTAVFLSGNPEGTPFALLHNLKHNKVLHERVVLLTIVTEDVPHVGKADRVRVEGFENGFFRVIGRYGFMEDPVVPEVLGRSQEYGLEFRPEETSFFLGQQNVVPTRRRGLAGWRARLFTFLIRNSQSATDYYRLPANRVVELGARIEV